MSPAKLAPVVFIHPRRCTLRYPLVAGEVRRHPVPSCPKRALAYDFACPLCGTRNTWLAAGPGDPICEGELVEERPAVVDEADREDEPILEPFRRPASLTTDRCRPCFGCKRELTIRNSVIQVA